MPHTDLGLFTIGVFKDVEWARRGLDALREQGFDAGVTSLVARSTPETAELARQALGADGQALDVPAVGGIVAGGTLVDALQGADRQLSGKGLAATMRRVGFQAHDGLIFEKLVEKGGVLVAIESESRAADALAVLHAFGGGNAAIGAWAGRV